MDVRLFLRAMVSVVFIIGCMLVAYQWKSGTCFFKLANTKQCGTILNLHFATSDPGGVESHLIMFNKVFTAHGFSTKVLTSHKASFVVDTLSQSGNSYGVPCVTYEHDDFYPRTSDILAQKPDVVICNAIGQLAATLKVREVVPVKIIYMQNNYSVNFSADELNNLNKVDGIVGVSPMVTHYFNDLRKNGVLKKPVVANIAPFFDDQKFLTFKPQRTRQEYLAEEYAITLEGDYPIITMIANMYYYKNQALLIKALDLVHKRGKKFHMLFAGSGPDLDNHTKNVRHLGFDKQIHFLGKVLNTPELLYHADIHLLASSHESFGLVHAEAALMKKPFIGATKTGIEAYIEQDVNGFVFENNNVESLANKLEFLLDNPQALKTMGERAYDFACKEFSAEATFNKWQKFLHEAL